MALALEYRNTHADFVTHYELALSASYLAGRSAHYRSVALWVGVVLLGSYAAFSADQIFLMCFLLAMGGLNLAQSIPYSRRYWAAVEQSLVGRPENQIRLEVNNDGLHETMDGIESFVPWASVKGFTIFRNTLFIELAAGLCAIVPYASVSTPTDVDALIKLLRDRGIEESPNQPVQRTGASRSGEEINRTSGASGSGR
jgi:hypothetical protein